MPPGGQRDKQQEARAGQAGLAADSALALVLAVVLTVATYFVSQQRVSVRPFDAGAAALVVASAAALAARRIRPVAVLAVVFVIVLAYLAAGYAEGPIWLRLIIAYFTAVVCGHRLAGVAAAVAVFGIFIVIHPLLGRGPAPSAAGLAAVAAWPLVILGAAEAVRIRRVRAAEAVAAGLRVRAETGGPVRELPFGVDQAAFRIVQEALTNVTRHAGTDTATVRVRYGQHDVTVQVDDDGRGRNDGLPRPGGSGIAGMRKRAAALGGDLHAGPRTGGGFRVTATLPLEGSE